MILAYLDKPRACLFALCVVAGSVAAVQARADVMDEIAERGVLRVGTAINLPWAMRDADGEMFGFEIDNAGKLATDLGVGLEIVELPFAELLSALDGKLVDVVAAGLSITPERALRAAFSIPYMTSDVGVVVRVADLADHDDIIGFNDPSVSVAAVADTTTEIAAMHALPSASLQLFDRVGATIDAFLAGEVTALVGETPVPELLMLENPDVFTMLPESLLSSGQAFAVHRDEHRFHTYLDNWVTAYETAGILESSRRYWFGGDEWIGRLDEPLVEAAIEDATGDAAGGAN